MTELFREEALSIEHDSVSWEDSIKISGRLLLSLGSIEEGYIQAMINAVHEHGPYMVIAPGIALAHAAAGKHVLKDDMVLTVFKEPILFHTENDPVHLVFGLCALQPHSHLDQLSSLADLLDDVDIVERFLAQNNCKQLYKFINGK